MYKNINTFLIIIALAVNSCATYAPQYVDDNFPTTLPDKEIEKSFYLIGDAGNADLGKSTLGLDVLKQLIEKENTTDDYLLYLGDNIYQKGMPDKNSKDRALSEHRIDAQIAAAESFNGDLIFIPGNHDWYNEGIKGVNRQEKYVKKKLGKNSFLPAKGCPIESIEVSNNIQLIILD